MHGLRAMQLAKQLEIDMVFSAIILCQGTLVHKWPSENGKLRIGKLRRLFAIQALTI